MDDINQKITSTMEEMVAKVYQRDISEVRENHNLRFKEDLNATSQSYFPLLAAFEDLDVEIDYHQFRYNATTVQTAIDYVIEQYNLQN